MTLLSRSLRNFLPLVLALGIISCPKKGVEPVATPPSVPPSVGQDLTSWELAREHVCFQLSCQSRFPEYAPLLMSVEFVPDAVDYKILNVVMGKPRQDVLDGYVDAQAVKKIRRFLADKNNGATKALKRVGKRYGPYAHLAVAVLWVESLLGTAPLKTYNALGALVSIAALDYPPFRKERVKELGEVARSRYKARRSNYYWDDRSRRFGSEWISQLKAFLELSRKLKWTPAKIGGMKGSSVGALGYGGYLPGTALDLMGKGDYDVWNWGDCIHLTAKLLKREAGSKEDVNQAILRYNPVGWYRETVLGVYRRILK